MKGDVCGQEDVGGGGPNQHAACTCMPPTRAMTSYVAPGHSLVTIAPAAFLKVKKEPLRSGWGEKDACMERGTLEKGLSTAARLYPCNHAALFSSSLYPEFLATRATVLLNAGCIQSMVPTHRAECRLGGACWVAPTFALPVPAHRTRVRQRSIVHRCWNLLCSIYHLKQLDSVQGEDGRLSMGHASRLPSVGRQSPAN